MKPFRRILIRFRNHPASVRNATLLIVTLTVLVVTIGALIVRIFDPQEYPTFGSALWFTLQTVTTVGYGDATPERLIGRLVASVVMVTGIGLLTVVTAAVTSMFIQAARARLEEKAHTEDAQTMDRVEASLTSIAERLDRLESMLAATATRSTHDDSE